MGHPVVDFFLFHSLMFNFKVIPEYLSNWGIERMRKNGITVIPEASISSAKLENGQVQITIADGQVVVADHIVVAIGIGELY